MIERIPVSVSAAGATVLRAGETDQPVTLLGLSLVATGAVTVKFDDGTNDLTGAMPLAANGVLTWGANPVGWIEAGQGLPLRIVLGGAVAVNGVAIVNVGGPLPIL